MAASLPASPASFSRSDQSRSQPSAAPRGRVASSSYSGARSAQVAETRSDGELGTTRLLARKGDDRAGDLPGQHRLVGLVDLLQRVLTRKEAVERQPAAPVQLE